LVASDQDGREITESQIERSNYRSHEPHGGYSLMICTVG
jgi:hypothetical protein